VTAAPELLLVEGVVAGYGDGPAILEGAGLAVRPGQVHCIIGPNGAGKSTLLKAIAGMLPIRRGRIALRGKRLDGLRPDQVLREGVAFVPQERALFPKMTVRENLRMGGFILRDERVLRQRIDEVMDRFPILRERAEQKAGTMSGGQQQTLSMARTLILRPEIVMLDEPSLGLAPRAVREMFDIVRVIADRGVTVLLVEQNAIMGLRHADWGVVLDLGRTLFQGPAAEVLADARIKELYLGGSRAA
jgi:branched-chain amino acid transport system ATP-binding protein